jgi:hypothetical protein
MPRWVDAGSITSGDEDVMADPAGHELLASYDAAIKMAARSLGIARALAEAHRAGLRPPDGILDAYLASIERDEAQLVNLREQGQRWRQAARLKT